MENWTEIKIAVNAADIDRAGDIANEVAPSGIYIEDYRDMEQVVEDIAHIDLIDEAGRLACGGGRVFERALRQRGDRA